MRVFHTHSMFFIISFELFLTLRAAPLPTTLDSSYFSAFVQTLVSMCVYSLTHTHTHVGPLTKLSTSGSPQAHFPLR